VLENRIKSEDQDKKWNLKFFKGIGINANVMDTTTVKLLCYSFNLLRGTNIKENVVRSASIKRLQLKLEKFVVVI
jgi:hypothetical protein